MLITPDSYRLLTTLASRGYIANNEHEYVLGSKILNLSAILLDAMDLPTLAHPYLRRLSAASGETTYVSIFDGTTRRDAKYFTAVGLHQVSENYRSHPI